MPVTKQVKSNTTLKVKQWHYKPGSVLPKQIQEEKDKFLNMKFAEKRLYYKCKNNYVTLDNIPNWSDYFQKEDIEPITAAEMYDINAEINSKVSIWSGDITALKIDSIVNAANSTLLGGSGVDGAIHSAAGKALLNECRELKGCSEGKSKITGGYWLPAKYVIHTVGPQGEKPGILRSTYLTSLELMMKKGLKSIAFPCISTGVYGYPPDAAAEVALQTVREFLDANSDKVDRVIFVVFLDEDKKIYEELMQEYFPLE